MTESFVIHSCGLKLISPFVHAMRYSTLSKTIFQPQARGQQTILYLSQTLINGDLPPSSFFALKIKGKATKPLGEGLADIG